MWLLHFYSVDEFAKFGYVEDALFEKGDFDMPETRSVDSGHKTFWIRINSLEIKTGEGRENNSVPRREVRGNRIGGGREMERKGLKLAHPGQGIRECGWWNMPSVENFVEPKINKVFGRIKKPSERGKGDPGQVETTEAWATPKSAGQSQLHAISRKKDKVFQF
jgi:hypothetical protein